jgi:restriction system protein
LNAFSFKSRPITPHRSVPSAENEWLEDAAANQGGFSKVARYEAERASIPLTLMDLDDLVTAIREHYEHMDADAKRLLALRKIYWPG